uniref:Uncharacterized protein n=1 Tax=Ditylenchus dipsaci TaxID=166011 RepID=A0A915CNH3_9BILA
MGYKTSLIFHNLRRYASFAPSSSSSGKISRSNSSIDGVIDKAREIASNMNGIKHVLVSSAKNMEDKISNTVDTLQMYASPLASKFDQIIVASSKKVPPSLASLLYVAMTIGCVAIVLSVVYLYLNT